MEQVLYNDTANEVILLGILVALATIALGLAVSGIYAVTAYSVARRTSEMGLRMALGARSTSVLRLVLKQSLMLVSVGMIFGLLGGLAFGQLTSGILYQVTPTDPLTFLVLTSVLLVTAFLGCYVPAVRATRLDPVAALRHQS